MHILTRVAIFIFLFFFLFAVSYAKTWTGSGFFIAQNGYAATAYHVVQGATRLEVFYEGQIKIAKVVAVDPKNDIAIIQISVDNKEFYNLDLGLKEEDKVFALGFPIPQLFGYEVKISKGVFKWVTNNQYLSYVEVFPGNSGGPLVTSNNNVAGVVVAGKIYKDDQIGFKDSLSAPAQTLYDLAIGHGINVTITGFFSKAFKDYSLSQLHDFAKRFNTVIFIMGTDDLKFK